MTQPSIIPGTPLPDRLSGTRRNDLILGKQSDDWLFGGAGSDTLDGGEGADTMIGGTGNDVYWVDELGDKVEELAGEGTDTVRSLINYILGAWVENLVLQGTQAIHGRGNELNNGLIGNVADNMLAGNAGNDTLDGGLGNDTLAGGIGDDTYCIDSLSDQIIEYAGEGRDTVRSTISYALGAELEKLILEKSENLNGHGNNLNNVIAGNSGNNLLTGETGLDTLIGGAGNDRLDGGIDNDSMIGGLGDDTYVVDRLRDAVVELDGQGRDTVESWISYGIGDHVENLTLLGSADLTGSGNDLDNVLEGNTGNNLLSGAGGHDRLGGGAGNDSLTGGEGNDRLDGGIDADAMVGGLGNDTYVVDRLEDTVAEFAGQGLDTVESWINYSLVDHVENLTLLGSAELNGYGNDLDNVLRGNTGRNKLMGGAGNDTLIGGAGINSLHGGTGNDRYIVGKDTYIETINERADEGIDTLEFENTMHGSARYSMGGNGNDLIIEFPVGTHGSVKALLIVTNGMDGNRLEYLKFTGNVIVSVKGILDRLKSFGSGEIETQDRQLASSNLGTDLARAMGTASSAGGAAGSAGTYALSSLLLAGSDGQNGVGSATSFTLERTPTDAAALALSVARNSA